ncbi:UNVERIFIED_CONTAM: hypothetical protein ABIC26_004198 [Paenibacillus sp. PvR008]
MGEEVTVHLPNDRVHFYCELWSGNDHDLVGNQFTGILICEKELLYRG